MAHLDPSNIVLNSDAIAARQKILFLYLKSLIIMDDIQDLQNGQISTCWDHAYVRGLNQKHRL
jgi:hypothetical protein